MLYLAEQQTVHLLTADTVVTGLVHHLIVSIFQRGAIPV